MRFAAGEGSLQRLVLPVKSAGPGASGILGSVAVAAEEAQLCPTTWCLAPLTLATSLTNAGRHAARTQPCQLPAERGSAGSSGAPRWDPGEAAAPSHPLSGAAARGPELPHGRCGTGGRPVPPALSLPPYPRRLPHACGRTEPLPGGTRGVSARGSRAVPGSPRRPRSPGPA